MALHLLPILQIIMLCTPSMLSYPVYGTKRYGRSSNYRTSTPSWVPVQTHPRTQRYPINYYEFYPYSQTYPDDYYYSQDSYPLYYPRTSKYEVYQAVLPYYYQDRSYANPNYGNYGYYGYDNDQVASLQEELLQEAEREEREESQPIGHEIMYENEDANSDENIDDVKAAFLQNLIVSQMYKDALSNYYDQYPTSGYYSTADYYNNDDSGNYAKFEDRTEDPRSIEEDEDVKELKQLAKPQHHQVQQDEDMNNIHWFQKNTFRSQKNDNKKKYDQYLSRNTKRNAQEHSINYLPKITVRPTQDKPTSEVATTQEPHTSTEAKREVRRGQKEEVMMRPATNVRHPFNAPVLEMMTKNDYDRKRSPSVYDKIKHMLDMEKSLEKNYAQNDMRKEMRPPMKKRLFTNEESLTQQLSVLKKKQ